jgi:hypothetical protein
MGAVDAHACAELGGSRRPALCSAALRVALLCAAACSAPPQLSALLGQNGLLHHSPVDSQPRAEGDSRLCHWPCETIIVLLLLLLAAVRLKHIADLPPTVCR